MATRKDIQKQVFNRTEASLYLGVAVNTLRRLLATEEIHCTHIGRRLMIPKKSLDNYIDKILREEVN